MSERTYWVGVAARAHVKAGIAGGYCQLGHGKHAPVKRLAPGDLIIYYSPRETLDPTSDIIQAFTGIGEVDDGPPYQAFMAAGVEVYRRDLTWFKAKEAPIRPMIGSLSFIKDPRRWGYPFHRGVFKIVRDDAAKVAAAMGVRRKV